MAYSTNHCLSLPIRKNGWPRTGQKVSRVLDLPTLKNAKLLHLQRLILYFTQLLWSTKFGHKLRGCSQTLPLPLRMLPLCLHKPPERVLAPQVGRVFRSNLLLGTWALWSFFSIKPHPLIDSNCGLPARFNIDFFNDDFLLAFAFHPFKCIYVDFISVNRFFEFRLKSFEWCLSCLSQRLCACFGEVCSWLARGCKVAGGWSAWSRP